MSHCVSKSLGIHEKYKNKKMMLWSRGLQGGSDRNMHVVSSNTEIFFHTNMINVSNMKSIFKDYCPWVVYDGYM